MSANTVSDSVKGDITGGITAAIIALPLALAFGVTAFAPLGPSYLSTGAMVGLLGCIYTGFFAAWFGGTPGQVTGPTGPMTVVATSVIAHIVQTHGADYAIVTLLLALTILVGGVTQIVLGFLGGGNLVKFIPYPVVAGFMNGIAAIIFIGQLKPFLGIQGDFHSFHLPDSVVAISVGSITLIAILASKRFSKKLPASLIGLIIGVAAYLSLGLLGFAPLTLENNRLVIGEIPNPFASWEEFTNVVPLFKVPHLPQLNIGDIQQMLIAGVALGVLGAIDSLLTSIVVDSITHTRHDSRKELVGQGIGNIVSGLGGGLAGAGATVRTLVNINAGGVTNRSGMLHAVIIFITVLLVSHYAAWIPLAALAGILFYTAFTMIDYYSLRLIKLRNVRREFFVMLVVTIVTVTADLMIAVGVGCVIAALFFITQQIKQPIVHRKMRGDELFARSVRTDHAIKVLREQGKNTLIYELHGSLFFGTTDAFLGTIEKDFNKARHFIFDMSRVTDIDLSGIQVLLSIIGRIQDAKGTLSLCGLTQVEKATPFSLHDLLTEMEVLEKVGAQNIFDTLDSALLSHEESVLADRFPEISRPLGLNEFEVLAGLTEMELAYLITLVKTRTVAQGEYIYKLGDTVDNLIFIRTGLLALMKKSTRKTIRLVTQGPGTVIGLRALMRDEQSRIGGGIRAETESELYLLPQIEIEALALTNPELLIKLQKELLHAVMERADVLTGEIAVLEER